ncbi:hypothetical protein LshimejAT787_0107700 [Lyophyllum shimeji]|uniref:Uncharacterized protein n=1 Tax=Lyophyllum shimeji TaxID=47721 RepID=A0A9P3PEA5_LYOSH|nr:hypothetical protein LshimejAT787_0107700 [Lyophyllum shimeji]
MTDIQHLKIPLPKFLKVFTSNNVPVPKAMALSAKIYKQYNTPAQLAQLDDIKLVTAGVDNKDDRKAVLAALRETGYLPKDARKKLTKKNEDSAVDGGPSAGPSTPSAIQAVTTPPKRKRKRAEDSNDLLPKGPIDEAATYGSLDFGEVFDEQILKNKSTVVNRAPLMMAWATVVAERLGFRREEALSIASVYTEMNAVMKGVSLGIYESGKERGMEAVKGGSQSYIELMGRRYVHCMNFSVTYPFSTSERMWLLRIPLYQTQTQQWRALSNGSPVKPSTAFSYISRAFRQTTPWIVGALKLLADSFSPEELNNVAWGLYAEFRPTVDRWGARSEVHCSEILDLRKKDAAPAQHVTKAEDIIKHEDAAEVKEEQTDGLTPARKKAKPLSLEEYEAALDDGFNYDDVDLDLDKT